MQTLITFIITTLANSLPDAVRMLPITMAIIRALATAFGIPMWEDGSLG